MSVKMVAVSVDGRKLDENNCCMDLTASSPRISRADLKKLHVKPSDLM